MCVSSVAQVAGCPEALFGDPRAASQRIGPVRTCDGRRHMAGPARPPHPDARRSCRGTDSARHRRPRGPAAAPTAPARPAPLAVGAGARAATAVLVDGVVLLDLTPGVGAGRGPRRAQPGRAAARPALAPARRARRGDPRRAARAGPGAGRAAAAADHRPPGAGGGHWTRRAPGTRSSRPTACGSSTCRRAARPPGSPRRRAAVRPGAARRRSGGPTRWPGCGAAGSGHADDRRGRRPPRPRRAAPARAGAAARRARRPRGARRHDAGRRRLPRRCRTCRAAPSCSAAPARASPRRPSGGSPRSPRSSTSRPAAPARTTRTGRTASPPHRDRRPAGWRTEETCDLVPLLAEADGPPLLDRLPRAVAHRRHGHGGRLGRPRVARRGGSARCAPGRTSSPPRGGRPGGPPSRSPTRSAPASSPPRAAGRRFRDELGRLNAAIAAESEHVLL